MRLECRGTAIALTYGQTAPGGWQQPKQKEGPHETPIQLDRMFGIRARAELLDVERVREEPRYTYRDSRNRDRGWLDRDRGEQNRDRGWRDRDRGEQNRDRGEQNRDRGWRDRDRGQQNRDRGWRDRDRDERGDGRQDR